MNCLVSEAKKIFSSKPLHNELNIIVNELRSNGYPGKHIKNSMIDNKSEKPDISTAEV